ncbi:hypothetical protein E2C01_080031 [Portunus trituberculatus]|uniref:Uncharacterized protein n=1 Tax=Portunus trituberculatus TaxID=210409 RepID=A0A5B7IUC6_PORTR|nr:hypothetical protein [Portunus trituberculatus]
MERRILPRPQDSDAAAGEATQHNTTPLQKLKTHTNTATQQHNTSSLRPNSETLSAGINIMNLSKFCMEGRREERRGEERREQTQLRVVSTEGVSPAAWR